jgi:hypothetical protein
MVRNVNTLHSSSRSSCFWKACILGILTLYSLPSFAQNDNESRKNLMIEVLVETIAEQAGENDENIDYNTLVDDLLMYSEKPLNLNKATFDDLQRIVVLSDIAISSLLAHREEHGKLVSILELQGIKGFSIPVIRMIMPFVEVNEDVSTKFTFKEMWQGGRHEIVLRYEQTVEQKKGYTDIEDSLLAASPNSRYLGLPFKIYSRYRFQFSNRVSWGLTMEKDAGEEFFSGNQKEGFDFYSAHLFLRNIGPMKAIAVGDFQAQFGQGLTFFSGLGFGKSANGVGIKRNAQGLRPYTSVDENRFLRGGGATIGIGKFDVTAFGSYKLLDANVSASSDTLTEVEEQVSSVFSSGFHRTPGELQDKDAVEEFIYGGNANYRNKRLQVGITAVAYQFSSILSRSPEIYNANEFRGKQNSNFGIDYSYLFRNFNFYGEVSMSQNLGFATTHGVLMTLDPKVTVAAMFRHLEANYQALYANAVTENSRTNNETGYYLGVSLNPFKGWYITGFFDLFRFPWLTYQASSPSYGYEAIGQLSFRPSRNLDISFRFRQKNKPLNISTEDAIDPIKYIEDGKRTSYRFHLSYSLSKSVSLRSRVEYSRYRRGDNEVEQGFMIYQDVIFKPLSFPVSFSTRLAYFDTDTYNSRIYAYENDVLYAYSFPAYYYRGMKFYANIRYDITRNISLWLRVANLFYADRPTIGSGLEEIDGKHRTDIKVQLRFTL